MRRLTFLYGKACRRSSWRPNLCFLDCVHLRWVPEVQEYSCDVGHMGGVDEIKINANTGKWHEKNIAKRAKEREKSI